MKNCPNCGKKFFKSKLLGMNLPTTAESTAELNAFLPKEMKRDGFCMHCIHLENGESILSSNYEVYCNKVKERLLGVVNRIDATEKEMIEKKLEKYQELDYEIVLYGNNLHQVENIELVESFAILESGMWSTSSDNLDPLWSAVHDLAARRGLKSSEKIEDALNGIKETLRKKAFLIGANCVHNVIHTFSELAGNGKTLIHCQGTAAVLDSLHEPQIFDHIHQECDLMIRKMNEEYDDLLEIVEKRDMSALKRITKELKFDEIS